MIERIRSICRAHDVAGLAHKEFMVVVTLPEYDEFMEGLPVISTNSQVFDSSYIKSVLPVSSVTYAGYLIHFWIQ